MPTEVLRIKCMRRTSGNKNLPSYALKFDEVIPEFVESFLKVAGFSVRRIVNFPYLIVTARTEICGAAMTRKITDVLCAWNEMYLGYFRTEDASRRVWVGNDFSLASASVCEPPANGAELRHIGRLRFELDCLIVEERYEEAKLLQSEISRLIAQVSYTSV